MDLERALALLSLPREIGIHPDSGEMITAGIGRFGPYLKLGTTYKSLGRDEDVLTVGINRAVELLATARKNAGRELGKHPDDEKPVTVKRGRFGPYVQHGSLRATISRDADPDTITLEQAIELLKERAAKAGAPKRAGAAKPKKAAAKPKAETAAEATGETPVKPKKARAPKAAKTKSAAD
jgi:DNA topoisomerase-1